MTIRDFKEGNDSLEKLGIGLKFRVKEWLLQHNITASQIVSDTIDGEKIFYIDVDGDMILDGYNLEDVSKIPKFIKFRNVNGRFILTNTK